MILRWGLVVLLVFLSWGIAYLRTGPILEAYSYSRQVFDRDGQLLRMTLSGDEKYRVFVPSDDFPEAFKEAVLLHEDRFFYFHPGLNPWSLVKAAATTYGDGARRIGGSTITMQLARMTSTRGSKTIFGKMMQIVRAIKLELFHSKREILEAYLNLLPYGANIEGLGAASRIYFNKAPSRLSIPEILTLVVIPQNPNGRSFEGGVENERRLTEARERIFKIWLERHPNDHELDIGVQLPVVSHRIGSLPFLAPHLAGLALERDIEGDFRKRGTVQTTVDLALQKVIERKVASYVNSKKRIGIQNAMAMVVNHETMEVISLVGSANFFDVSIEGQVNGTRGKRSPGSSLKPFVYALSLDQGLIHPRTLLKDTPASFGGFDPENFDKIFVGPIAATEALIHSRNVPAVSLASMLQTPSLYDFLKSSGISRLRESSYYGLSVALGGAEVTMEELVKLYAALANLGEMRSLRYLKSDPLVVEAKPISREAAFLTLDMLRQNERDDQKYVESWVRDSIPIAWKTGTSQGFRDAWTTGVVGPYVVSVWLGNFAGEGNRSLIGREVAAPLFFSIVDSLRHRVTKRVSSWSSPQGLEIKKVKVCSISGKLPGPHCRHQVDSWFIPGKSPIASCDVHREVLISRRSGRRSCTESLAESRKEVFEFWPSDVLQIFKLAGVARKTPPPFDEMCQSRSDARVGGIAPSIVSPRNEVVYSMRVTDERESQQNEVVPLAAVADGDVKKLHWFIGNEYLGQSEPQKPMIWRPRPGHYRVRVVDDQGRADSRAVDVKVTR